MSSADKPTGDDPSAKYGEMCLSALRKKARDLTRLLAKPNLDAAVKSSKEVELAAVIKCVGKKSRIKRKEEHSKDLTALYRKVMFYDKAKVGRKMKVSYSEDDGDLQKARKAIEKLRSGDDEATKGMTQDDINTAVTKKEEELRALESDLIYVNYYPKEKKYISLFPSDIKDVAEHQKKVSDVRELINKRLKEQQNPQTAPSVEGEVNNKKPKRTAPEPVDDDFFADDAADQTEVITRSKVFGERQVEDEPVKEVKSKHSNKKHHH